MGNWQNWAGNERCEATIHNVAEDGGNVGANLRDREMLGLGDVVNDRGQVVGGERMLAADQLVHHDPEGEYVGLIVQSLLAYLFW